MKFKILFLFLIILTALSTSCNQTPTDATPAATLEIINLQITPELENWMPEISQCAETIEGIGIYTQILTQAELDINQTDLVLKLGQKDESDPYVAVMGFEEIVVIGGSKVPINTLSIESLQAIFRGTVTNWGDLPEVSSQGIKINQPIQTFSFPDGHILQQLFSLSYLESDPVQTEAIPYSTVEGLAERLQKNPYGIAYLLKTHTTNDHKIITIMGIETSPAQQFVLAITKNEPQGRLKQLLLCLQNIQ
ncbi:MAG: substrate-binding domain-containing protein [Chloroflexota bacterium]|nr:substrate-binding domain-containing protein [Chloroflexota bacterium]